jgi:nitrite reductase/ring-hydroxylating ferredoxin subunit
MTFLNVGKKILLANVDGKVYTVSDRCGHMMRTKRQSA